jgi:ATP-binding cassette subfamily F protein uup
MLKKTNLLVLDEPTNDLDLPTLQVLEDCLADFPGAVILVTHDRYFLDRVTNRILAFSRDEKGHGMLTALAGLDQWEAWHAEQKGAAPARRFAAKVPARKRRVGFNEQRELDGMEERIQAAEAARNDLREQSENPAHASDAPKLVALLAALAEKQAEIDRLYARWSDLQRLAP